MDTILSKDECVKILKQVNDNVELEHFEVVPASDDILGFLGEYFKLKIYTKDVSFSSFSISYLYLKIYHLQNQNFQFFVKSMPLKNEHQREIIETGGHFKKEVLLYSLLFSKMVNQIGESKWRPTCYLAKPELLVLEDIHDYNHVLARTSFSELHVIESLKGLARMHSACFEFEESLNMNLDEKFEDVFQETITRDNPWLLSGFSSVKAVALNNPKFKDIFDKINENIISEFNKIFDVLEHPLNLKIFYAIAIYGEITYFLKRTQRVNLNIVYS